MKELNKLLKYFKDDEKVIDSITIILELMKQCESSTLTNATMLREFKFGRMTVQVAIDKKYPYF